MRVVVEIRSETLLQEVARGSEVGMEIFFEHQGVCYPGAGWNDFGIRLLSFWVHCVRQVREAGATTVELAFLDGNFTLTGEIDSDGRVELVPENAVPAFSWNLPWADVEAAVVRAARLVHARVLELGVQPGGFAGLDAGLRVLAQLPE